MSSYFEYSALNDIIFGEIDLAEKIGSYYYELNAGSESRFIFTYWEWGKKREAFNNLAVEEKIEQKRYVCTHISK